MNILKKIMMVFLLFGGAFVYAQVIGLGGKYSERPMFQASFNVPLFFDKDKPYDFAFGLDYTTGNKNAPSGLQPQATAMYFLVDDRYKSYMIFTGFTVGYLFDFNKQFDHQFRITPHLYLEVPLFFIKTGYDYSTSLQKGYPFISIGFGGGYLFRHFSVM